MDMDPVKIQLSEKTTVYITPKAKTGNHPYVALLRRHITGSKGRVFYMKLDNMLQVGALNDIYLSLGLKKVKNQWKPNRYLCIVKIATGYESA